MRRGILATRQDLQGLAARIGKKPFDAFYDALRKRCAKILESSPMTEQHWRSMWQQGVWASGLQAARTSQGRIFDLLIAHHIDANPAYRGRAVEELRNLVGWTNWVDPCHSDQLVDLCTAEAAVAAAVGLDWLWEDLSEPDRLRVMQAIRKKVVDPYLAAVKAGAWWYSCYHAWNAVVNSGCAIAAMALSDDEPLAARAGRQARDGLRHFFDALGREGGWDEGIGYWGYAMRYVCLLAEASSRLLHDQSIYHTRGMNATGLFPIYFTPNGHPASFGDSPVAPLYGALYLLARHYGQKELAWWLDAYAFHRDVGSTGWSSVGLALLFRPADLPAAITPGLAPVKVFNEIGWAAMADAWPRPKMYLAAKTGDLSAHHSQRDMNSIQFQADGEMVLTDPGQSPQTMEFAMPAKDDFYEVQARAHNTIILSDSDHRIDAQGSIIEAQAGDDFRWLACEAGDAFGQNNRFIRHAILLMDPAAHAGRGLVVVDELHLSGPAQADLFWHVSGPVHLDAHGMSGQIAGQLTAMHFALACTSKAAAAAQTRPLGHGQTDNIIRLAVPAAEKTFIVSVFSRESQAGKLHVKTAPGGVLNVQTAHARLAFRSNKRNLQLEKVSFKS
ncbi:MAG: heparinase II/III family protein [Planctomycetes bacterium]|nr:heparinase II/III family protein [Planctomycetota bacterium]